MIVMPALCSHVMMIPAHGEPMVAMSAVFSPDDDSRLLPTHDDDVDCALTLRDDDIRAVGYVDVGGKVKAIITT